MLLTRYYQSDFDGDLNFKMQAEKWADFKHPDLYLKNSAHSGPTNGLFFTSSKSGRDSLVPRSVRYDS